MVTTRAPTSRTRDAGRSGRERGYPASLAIGAQMRDLAQRVTAAIEAEGLQVAVDAIDLDIAISRGLVAATEDGAEIRVPVRKAQADPSDDVFADLLEVPNSDS